MDLVARDSLLLGHRTDHASFACGNNCRRLFIAVQPKRRDAFCGCGNLWSRGEDRTDAGRCR